MNDTSSCPVFPLGVCVWFLMNWYCALKIGKNGMATVKFVLWWCNVIFPSVSSVCCSFFFIKLHYTIATCLIVMLPFSFCYWSILIVLSWSIGLLQVNTPGKRKINDNILSIRRTISVRISKKVRVAMVTWLIVDKLFISFRWSTLAGDY